MTRSKNIAKQELDDLAKRDQFDNKQLISALKNELHTLKSDIGVQIQSLKTEFSSLLEAKNKEISELKLINQDLRIKMVKLENMVDDGDAYERRDTVILTGSAVPAVSQGEICNELVKKLVKDVLKLEINTSDISTSHRIGKKRISQEADRRNLIVKFCRRDVKHSVISASKNQTHRTLFHPFAKVML